MEHKKEYYLRDWRQKNSKTRWAIRVRIRDKWACKRCGSEENPQCHHILSQAEFPKWARVLANSITLCGNCHFKLHNPI